MENRFKEYGYNLTSDPSFQNKGFGVTPELQKEIKKLEKSIFRGGKDIINKLLKMIEAHPQVPTLKNLLCIAYNKNNQHKKAIEVNHWIVKEHPDYLFGKLNLASEYIFNEEFDKAEEVLGKTLQLKDLYPMRDLFHFEEFISYNMLAVQYLCAVGKIGVAESYIELLNDLMPNDPRIEDIENIIGEARMIQTFSKMEAVEERNKTLRQTAKFSYPDIVVPPNFNHSEINLLYKNGLRITRADLEQILSLPRQSLIKDLEGVMTDAFDRYNYFKSNYGDDWPEEKLSSAFHAIFLLSELRAYESLPKILDLLSYDEDFLEFWFGEHLTESLWEPLFYLGENQVEIFREYINRKHVYTYVRSALSCTLTQIVHHKPDRRNEIIDLYRNIIDDILKNSPEQDLSLHDGAFFGLLISDLVEINAIELLPSVKELFENDWVAEGVCGSYKSVAADIQINTELYERDLMNIFERYNEIVSTWYGYSNDFYDSKNKLGAQKKDEYYDESEKSSYDDFSYNAPIVPIRSEPKIGRNDPCPCGSGKKYKKCCLKE